ncbi:MAG: hypothetical protein HQ556_11495 [Candidatus Marinimicrobia bacterium]|nr:hypothetical protein [Candidatus Neomarinimicrobiota bacterium]
MIKIQNICVAWINTKWSNYRGLAVALIIILGYCSEPSADRDAVRLSTTKINYLSSDTISVRIDNDSEDIFNFGLRCGGYLEMFYQQKVDGDWSEDQWFFYMSYLCPTLVDSVQTGEYFEYNLPAEWFEDVGTFRLRIGDLYSKQFQIE